MNNTFSETLKKIRTKKGLSQTQMGKQLFVNQSTVARWESGIRLPDAEMITHISRILDVDVSTLLLAAARSEESPHTRQVTMDFTSYLQKNFNAVASGNLITFAAELEHTRAYLAVEQAMYDEMLFVGYDTPFTQFRLPPLTLQPIVENAVKHGMNLDSDPLRVSSRTRHTNDGGSGSSAAEIIVEDNGPGFDPSDGSRPHPVLKNIQKRLEMMCGGALEITSREAGGTMVTIRVPLRNTK